MVTAVRPFIQPVPAAQQAQFVPPIHYALRARVVQPMPTAHPEQVVQQARPVRPIAAASVPPDAWLVQSASPAAAALQEKNALRQRAA